MTDIIDSAKHAHLIELQRAVNQAYAALDGHAPGVRGVDLSDEQREESVQLRARVSEAVMALRAGLYESGLVEEHGYYTPSQDLKNTVRALDAPAAASEEEPAQQ